MEAKTAEDIIWMLCAISAVGGALFLERKMQDSLGMKILRILWYPLKLIAQILDAQWWGEKLGFYDKAGNSKVAKWSAGHAGWRWWLYQIGVGIICIIVIEIVLNLLGLSLLPWRW